MTKPSQKSTARASKTTLRTFTAALLALLASFWTLEPAFAEYDPSYDELDDEIDARPSGGKGKWIALILLLLVAGAGGTYFAKPELFDFLFVRTAHYLGRELWREGDATLIDGLEPDGITAVTRNLAARVSRLQSGFVYHYAFAMLIGVAGLITLYLFTLGG